MASVEENKATVAKFFTGIRKADPAVLDLLREDGEWWVSGKSPVAGTWKKADVKDIIMGMQEIMFPNGLNVYPGEMVGEGNRVMVEAETRDTKTASGQDYSQTYVFTFELDDQAMLKKVREYVDTAYAAEIATIEMENEAVAGMIHSFLASR